MEPSTGLSILGASIGSAKLIEKILGPTAEYIGDGIKDWTQKRLINVKRIFDKAQDKLGDKINDKGVVSPRVLKVILNEGSFFDDELSAEYFGGVLASSRTNTLRDDRGAAFLGLVTRLSSYQLRTHYIFYSCLKYQYDIIHEYLDDFGSVLSIEGRNSLRTEYPISSYNKSMDFSENEDPELILSHSIFGISREALISEPTSFNKTTIIFTPSAHGVELYLWAHGLGQTDVDNFFNPNIEIPCKLDIIVTKGCYLPEWKK